MELLARLLLGLLWGLSNFYFSYFDVYNYFNGFIFSFLFIFLIGLQLQYPDNWKRALSRYIPLSLIYALPFTYLLVESSQNREYFFLYFPAFLSFFIVFCYYCASLIEKTFDYQTLFFYAWQKLLLILFALLFNFLVLSIFFLASWLFNKLGSTLLSTIVYSRWFNLIISPLFFVIGLYLFNQYAVVIDKTRALLLALFKVIYPLFATICIIFMIGALFSTKPMSEFWWLITVLCTVNIFMLNAVYQDGSQPSPYPKIILGIIYGLLLLQPFYLISFFYFPIDEMRTIGFSISTYVAFLMLFLLSLYAISYFLALFNKRDTWLPFISKANTALAVVVAIIFFLMATPILNPHNIISTINKHQSIMHIKENS